MITGGAAAAVAGLTADTARADLCHSKAPKETVILTAEVKAKPGMTLFYEHWSNQKTVDAHVNSPHIKGLMKKLEGKTESLTITFLEPMV